MINKKIFFSLMTMPVAIMCYNSSEWQSRRAEEKVVEEKKEVTVSEEDLALEDKLDLLAKKLSKAKIIPKEDVAESPASVPEFTGKKIISETLAEIHIKQKNFAEAIIMYEELLSQKPEKVEYYLQRISDIRTMMPDETQL